MNPEIPKMEENPAEAQPAQQAAPRESVWKTLTEEELAELDRREEDDHKYGRR